jgi:predicted TIM-barrel fold metal-dependent hydrolase
VVGLGARVVHVRPAPVPTGGAKGRSLGDPLHDPVWATLAAAGVPVAFHLGDSGYQLLTAAWGGAEEFDPFRGFDPLDRLLVSDRAIHDTIGSIVVHGVFTRHPTLKVASIENGSDWVYTLLKRLRKLANQNSATFIEDPLDTIRRHLWITPYYEEDLRKLADTIGVDRVLFGSDWPHGEGLADPASFTDELSAFDPSEVDMIMRTNCAELVGLPV